MALQHVRDQKFQRLGVPARREELEGADTDVTAGHAAEHGARQERFARYLFPGGHRRQRPGGRQAQGVHGLTDDVFAQHRAQGSAAVAAAGVGRGARALQLDVVASTVGADDLAQQEGAAVPELRVIAAELMAGVHCGDRLAAGGNGIARQHGGAFRRLQPLRCYSQQCRQRVIDADRAGVRHRCGLPA